MLVVCQDGGVSDDDDAGGHVMVRAPVDQRRRQAGRAHQTEEVEPAIPIHRRAFHII